MWLATGDIDADLSKDFSKKVLEIVLDTKILAPSMFSVLENSKTPKALLFSSIGTLSDRWVFG